MRRSNTESIGALLKQQRIEDRVLDKKMAELNVVKMWEQIMGATIAQFTQEVSIKEGALYLKLSSPLMKNEILMMREQIIEHINKSAGGELIQRIVFR
ncbi:MAG: DUF721 domain-containing protein [Mangrovibacterium sp.]